MEAYFHFYNEERLNQKLNMKTPCQFETEYHKHCYNKKCHNL
ncbi:IS3 family transposase [Ruminococcus sp. zg-924]